MPANFALTPFDVIAENSWDSRGDLHLRPDLDSSFNFHLPSASPFAGILCDILDARGQPWAGCGRSFLARAVADLKQGFGLEVDAAFEHEFFLIGRKEQGAPAFSISAMRRHDPFGPMLLAALEEAGVLPETILPEFGRDQFEATCAPTHAVGAADRAVILREVVREVARSIGVKATFSPKPDRSLPGSGVHIHFSLRDAIDGAPRTYDRQLPGGMSRECGSFTAGLLEHLPALLGVLAPSPVSYLRLRPGTWSSGRLTVSESDREAAIRICGGDGAPAEAAKRFNLELRSVDAACGPHWALGLMLRAGLDGLRRGLAAPELDRQPPEAVFPTSAGEALQALESSKVVRRRRVDGLGRGQAPRAGPRARVERGRDLRALRRDLLNRPETA